MPDSQPSGPPLVPYRRVQANVYPDKHARCVRHVYLSWKKRISFTQDCLERPRRVGAKFTGEDIKADELLPGELNFDFDGKRDRWSGYDVTVHKKVVEEYAKVDEAKRQLKASKLEEELEVWFPLLF